MSDILDKICATKRAEVLQRQSAESFSAIRAKAAGAPKPRGFSNALKAMRGQNRYGLIAEIKKASPSKGLIRKEFNPPTLARAYANGGAACLSVVTDVDYFQGADSYLIAARESCVLPVLRKDFMINSYQIPESRALGADCILLIMAAIDDTICHELRQSAGDLGMDVLIEVHDEAELDRALRLSPELVGINNRNLKTFEVDLGTTLRLAPQIPDDVLVVSESGLKDREDLAQMARIGVTTFLIGESLMRESDVASATRSLLHRETVAA